MIDVSFDIRVIDDETTQDDPLLDTEARANILAHTKAQLERHVQRALGEMRCAEHDKPAVVQISGTYSLDTEQLEVSYNMDTCCQPFLAQAIMALNRR